MESVIKAVEENKFVGVIRASSAEDAEEMIKSALAGGIRVFEISMHMPQAIRIIESFSKTEDLLIGAGGVSDGEMAQRVINAGARFVSSPYTDRDIINVVKNNDSVVIQGALTPTEALNAHQFGADLVKVYPADLLGGAEYIKALRNAIPFLKIFVDADVTLENAFEYLKNCVAVTLRSAVFGRALLRANNWAEMTERARQFTQRLEASRVAK